MKHQQLSTTPEISRRMANVHLKRGPEETRLAKELWHQGFRYWLNYKKLPGSPDIAIQKYHIAVFVDGEFWHGYDWANRKPRLKNNREYWIEKIEENMSRDARVDQKLVEIGWVPIHFWSKEVQKDLDNCIKSIREIIIKEQVAL